MLTYSQRVHVAYNDAVVLKPVNAIGHIIQITVLFDAIVPTVTINAVNEIIACHMSPLRLASTYAHPTL